MSFLPSRALPSGHPRLQYLRTCLLSRSPDGIRISVPSCSPSMVGILQPALVALASIAITAHYTGLYTLPTRSVTRAIVREPDTERLSCRPFLPNLFVDTPPALDNAHIAAAAQKLDAHLTARFAQGDLDALSVAVVTSAGSVLERNYGVINGNASSDRRPLHSHAQYRVASVSKLILVLEAWILQERGVLSWEDPVDKFIPGFTYRAGAFSPSPLHADAKATDAPITVYQLGARAISLLHVAHRRSCSHVWIGPRLARRHRQWLAARHVWVRRLYRSRRS